MILERPCALRRPSNVMSKAFRAAFQRFVHRLRPFPVGSRLLIARYRHFRAGLLGREVAAGVHRPPQPGINRLDRVCRADHRPYFPVEPQERHEFRPRVLPQPYNSRVALLPFPGELGEPVQRLGFGRGSVNRLEIFRDLRPVPPRGVLE
jgi:hypothetical protein